MWDKGCVIMKSIYEVSYSVDSSFTVDTNRKTSVAAESKKEAIKEAQKRFPEGYLFKVTSSKPCREHKTERKKDEILSESIRPSHYKGLEIVECDEGQYDEFGGLKEGYVEVGDKVYRLPTSGYSHMYESTKKIDGVNFRYNYKKRVLEAVDTDCASIIEAKGVLAENFIESPQEQVDQYADELEEDTSWL